MRALYLLIAVLMAVTCGCDRSPPTVAAKQAASYKFEVRGPGGVYNRGDAGSFSVTSGQTTASLQDGRLTVNGKSYGQMKDGDSILVEESGKVSVNGTARSPE